MIKTQFFSKIREVSSTIFLYLDFWLKDVAYHIYGRRKKNDFGLSFPYTLTLSYVEIFVNKENILLEQTYDLGF